MVSVDAADSRRDSAGLQRCRLRAHVGEQVDRRLLHRLIRQRAAPRSWLPSRPHVHCTVPAPKTSAPLACR